MAKTIVFKPEFEEKLKKLKIKTKFIYNIKRDLDIKLQDTTDKTLIKRIEELDDRPSWRLFILGAFVWEYTPEGKDYWSYISTL
jgi:hypothetical protein